MAGMAKEVHSQLEVAESRRCDQPHHRRAGACEETKPNSYVSSHAWRWRRWEKRPTLVNDKEEGHIDDARCAVNAVIMR
jgi:hypothetical protein